VIPVNNFTSCLIENIKKERNTFSQAKTDIARNPSIEQSIFLESLESTSAVLLFLGMQ
jgi:hypothetical protein